MKMFNDPKQFQAQYKNIKESEEATRQRKRRRSNDVASILNNEDEMKHSSGLLIFI